MVVTVVRPFVDVMGVRHETGATLTISETAFKRYADFVAVPEPPKKGGKRKNGKKEPSPVAEG